MIWYPLFNFNCYCQIIYHVKIVLKSWIFWCYLVGDNAFRVSSNKKTGYFSSKLPIYKYLISLFLLNSYNSYNLCNDSCSWMLKTEVMYRYLVSNLFNFIWIQFKFEALQIEHIVSIIWKISLRHGTHIHVI